MLYIISEAYERKLGEILKEKQHLGLLALARNNSFITWVSLFVLQCVGIGRWWRSHEN